MAITTKRKKMMRLKLQFCFSLLTVKLISKFDIQIIKENGNDEGQQSWAERGGQEFFSEENRFLCQQFAV